MTSRPAAAATAAAALPGSSRARLSQRVLLWLCIKIAAEPTAACSVRPLPLRPLARRTWPLLPRLRLPRLPAAHVCPPHKVRGQLLLHKVRLRMLLGTPAGLRLLHLPCCACWRCLIQVQQLRR